MALGTKGFEVIKGDLVRVVSGKTIVVPLGTIAPVYDIFSGREKGYRLAGYEHICLGARDLEVVCYVR